MNYELLGALNTTRVKQKRKQFFLKDNLYVKGISESNNQKKEDYMKRKLC